MKLILRCFLFILIDCICILNSIIGQVSSTTADWKIRTAYLPSDTIFVFHQYPLVQKGSLTVTNPFLTEASFTWSQYDTLSNTFGPALKTENNVFNSSLDNLSEGGYKISITGTTRDTSFMAWIYFDNYSLAVDKDNAGKVIFGKYTCDYVDLSSKVTPIASFFYEDPSTHHRLVLKDTFTYVWSANPAPEIALTNVKASFRNYLPPYKDTRYTVTVTDRFGLIKEDDVLYESIQVKALFETKYDSVVDSKNSAPLKVTFINKCENADSYVWYMGD